MKRSIRVFVAVLVAAQLAWAQQPLPITRVLLSKNGMAYIVRSGQLTAPISLTFHPEDMNDVLKSFTAWNPDTGNLYSVGYTTGIPSSYMLGRFPFNITDPNVGLGGFLTQVKGAAVRLDVGGKPLEGKLVAAQQTDHVITQQTSTPDYRLTVLLAEGSLQTVWLSEVRSVEFVDPALRDQLRSYLDVLKEGRQDVTREISIYPVPSAGPIRVAYLQQFPLWKTSYRVDLGAKDTRIQGWAQIDNPTGESWDNVEVSLLSGAPVSFVMNLYDPLYTSRASVAVPGGQVAAPRQYESAVRESEAAKSSSLNGRFAADEEALAFAPATAAPAPLARGARGGGAGGGPGAGGGFGGGGGRGGAAAPANLAPQQPNFQQAQATQIEDYFEYRFPFPVRLASRQSALLPFLQKTMDIERLSIYNQRTDRGNPQLGARLTNTTDIPFEPGPVTFFEEGRYTGEAVLDYLARGEKRLISYGIDHDIQIATKAQTQPEVMARLTIERGVAVLFMERTQTTTYEIRSKSASSKTLIVEHARVGDRKVKGDEPWESTDSYYRFRVNLKAGEMTELPVTEIISRQTNVSLTSLNRQQLVNLFSNKQTPQQVQTKLGQIVDTQEQIATLQNNLRLTEQSIDTLFKDQERLRENIKALRDTREEQELRSRYLDQLTKQENQITTARAQVETLKKDITNAQNRLSDMISTLSWQG
ncbi:MAG TPA: hypothetical protein VFY29_12150 [Terriglobia bacterium]|nr:hypothetical protein [Terriglobia bacterium]